MAGLDRLEEVKEYLNGKQRECMEEERQLREQQRGDEAMLCQVRKNIYEIFETMITVATKQFQDQEAQEQFFEKKLETLPQGWQETYRLAKEHEDVRTVLIEETKQQVVEDIRNTYDSKKA